MMFQITTRTKRVVAGILVAAIVAAGAAGAVSSATGGNQPVQPAPQTQPQR
jgi:hypothetical protein